jgi:hypothetical protein
MGYTTNFDGGLKFNRVLNVTEFNHLKDFSEERHDESDYPGIWCQWVSNDEGTELVWDGGEKFYEYVEWLEWLIDNYFESQSLVLNGTIRWQGEDISDVGRIDVKDNHVTTTVLDATGVIECPNCSHKFKIDED